MKTIVVNATALDSSGALSILRQFVEAIPDDCDVRYVIFISPSIDLKCGNASVRLVPIVGVKSFVKRFVWDAFGVKKWLKANNIKPTASISLQNTNFRTGYKIPNYVYYHQSIPFVAHRWSPFKAEERTMWFYKNVYPFFVQIFLNCRTEVFVQLEFIKEGFAKRFGFDRNKIHVVRPKTSVAPSSSEDIKLPSDRINLFYPATPFFYKNHKMLFDALWIAEISKFQLSLTCEKEQFDYDTPQNIAFLGVMKFESVMAMYKACDAVVFPSYIETFGLPLIEAASTGCPIIAADLPYAREVLGGYDGATFVPFDKPQLWCEAIGKLGKNRRFQPLILDSQNSWQRLFEIITK